MATKDQVKLNEWYASLNESAQHELIRIAISEDTDVFAVAVENMLFSKNYDKEQIRVFHIFVKSVRSLANNDNDNNNNNTRKGSNSASYGNHEYESKRDNSRSRSRSHSHSPSNRNNNNNNSSGSLRNIKNTITGRSIIAQNESLKNDRQQSKTTFKSNDGQEVGARFSALRVEEIFPEFRNNAINKSSDNQRTNGTRSQSASRGQAPISRVVVASQSTYNAPNSLTTNYKPHTALLFSPNSNGSKTKIQGPIVGASPVSLPYTSKLSVIRDEEKRQDDLFDARICEPSVTQNSDSDREASRADSYSITKTAVPARPKNPGYVLIDAEESVIDAKRTSPRSGIDEDSTILKFHEPEEPEEPSRTTPIKKAQDNVIKPTEDSDSDDEIEFRRAMTE